MAKEEEYKYDPESGEDTKKYRLPFALCKARGIAIQDWWTPRDAWNALQNNGYVKDVDEEYADYYRKKKRDRQKEFDKANPWLVAKKKARAKVKKLQLADAAHNPDKNYTHVKGAIASAQKGKPMDFKQADNGNVNPFFMKAPKGQNHEYIGYRTNCQTCVATYVARRKGYDVRALPNLNNKSIHDLSYDTSLAYVDSNGQHPKHQRISSVSELSFNMAPGSMYSVQFDYVGRSSGHIVVVEKDKNGKVFLYDPQTNRVEDQASFKGYSKGKSNFRAMDLTNVSLDEKFCDKIMKKR